jgi:hypothetical protein
MEVSGQLHTVAALPLGKELQVNAEYRLGRSQSRSGGYGEEKNLMTVSGIEPRSFIS